MTNPLEYPVNGTGLDPLPTLAELVWPRSVTEVPVPSASGCGRPGAVLYLIGRMPTALDNPAPRLPRVLR